MRFHNFAQEKVIEGRVQSLIERLFSREEMNSKAHMIYTREDGRETKGENRVQWVAGSVRERPNPQPFNTVLYTLKLYYSIYKPF
jgi:hypothetical protein